MSGTIEIVRRPDGEAPEWVRDAWIGMRLPLAADGVQVASTVSVLHRPSRLELWLERFRKRWPVWEGYMVNASVAVDLLEAVNAEAAAWWRANSAHMLDGAMWFMFDAPSCRPVDGAPAKSWPSRPPA